MSWGGGRKGTSWRARGGGVFNRESRGWLGSKQERMRALPPEPRQPRRVFSAGKFLHTGGETRGRMGAIELMSWSIAEIPSRLDIGRGGLRQPHVGAQRLKNRLRHERRHGPVQHQSRREPF